MRIVPSNDVTSLFYGIPLTALRHMCKPKSITDMLILSHTQGWEAQPRTHLNANFKSINIC